MYIHISLYMYIFIYIYTRIYTYIILFRGHVLGLPHSSSPQDHANTIMVYYFILRYIGFYITITL